MSMTPRPLRCETISWGEVHRLTHRLAAALTAADYLPDAIVAIGRGGYIPARLLADLLDIFDLSSFKIEHYTEGARRTPRARVRYPLCAELAGKRVLIVDDVSDTGETFALALEHVRSRAKPCEIRTAALHHKTVSSFEPDYYAHRITKWRWLVYPWALVEDTSGFITRLQPIPTTRDEAAMRLAQEFGLHIPPGVVEDAYRVLARRGA